ncbi:MAG: MarC family protein [Desulfobacterales bacterium]|jgi:multiple antibiotic resistance protein|nr:MarC family protein [Desulfobacteraceae bacterium]MBT7086694.1 MarC family protein [Desulfobacterales bacterium]MBT7698507.1 MarC family protein [Desulfobacterales bacterium]
MKTFWLCFVPMFVAVDAIGVLPVYLGLTENLPKSRRTGVLIQSLITALVVALVFLIAGPALLRLIGITVPDFMVAGGILLLVISLYDLLTGEKKQQMVDTDTLGAVPIGIPLITGPAVLTLSVVLVDTYGIIPTTAAVVINITIAIIVFWFSKPIAIFLGNTGTKTLSKIASLLLASIAVMLIRKGVIEIIHDTLNYG